MKETLKKIIVSGKIREKDEILKSQNITGQSDNSRRSFLKKAALGGIALGGFMHSSIEDTIAQTTSKVNRASSPSELKITDMRCAVVGNVGLPAWQLLGGRYRDKVRLYADTPGARDPVAFAETMRRRVEIQEFTWLKMDLGIHVVANQPDSLVNTKFWNGATGQYDLRDYMGYGSTLHPFTQVQITDKGLAGMAEYVEQVRNVVGYEMPLCADHFGHFDINNSIRFGRAMEKYRLAWLEDMVPWFYTEQWRTVSDAIETPTCTGEDIYMLKGGFKPLLDARAVDIIHPDLATSGGLLETKRIGDYAEESGVAMAMHMAGTPVCFMANVHCAAATQNFLSLEHHSVDTPWWESLVKVTGSQPMITKGFANVPLDSPGLGIELNEEEVKKHLHPRAKGFFEPTPEWNAKRSHDRLWS